MDEKKFLLSQYYEKLFPFNDFYQWLSHGDASFFHKREFSFTVDDIYLRYKAYKTSDDFKKAVLSIIPSKLDIGPAYTVSPSEQHSVPTSKFVPVAKEYVLDIDISDYDNVRYCGCKEAKVCKKCWQLMDCGAKILDYLLSQVFGFDHRLWVFSGRRGIHCWVSDQKAMDLKNNERSAMTEFLQVYKKKVYLGSPNLIFDVNSKVFKIAEEYFLKIFCGDMCEMMDDSEKWKDLINTISTEKIQKAIIDLLKSRKDSDDTPREKWEKVKQIITQTDKFGVSLIPEIVYSFVYPRLDANVSKGLNHLLKSPFSVHPSTGNICVPFNVKEDFDIENPPNVKLLENEKYKEKTAKYFKIFTKFVQNLKQE